MSATFPAESDLWPSLPYREWADTCDTLHMWTQIVGKVKLALCPFLNEWWEVALHVTPRGLTSGRIPYRRGIFEVSFDLIDHRLSILTSDDTRKDIPLIPRSVAGFYAAFMESLRDLGIEVAINPMPTEVPNPIAFDRDDVHASYDATYVDRFRRVLVQTAKVMDRYRSPFVGKSSPVLFFWGSFDLTETRFSGRPAPAPEGAPRFFQIAEDQENFACGFWPGNPTLAAPEPTDAAFYSYIYPAPVGMEQAAIWPEGARFDTGLGEFILPLELLRGMPSPSDALLEFYQSTYEACATLAGWNRATLEQVPP